MDKTVVIIITMAVYVLLMAVIGVMNSKSSSGGVASFTVGKRNAGAWISALSYGAAYFSAVMFIGYSGRTGWDLWLWASLVGLANAVIGSWLAWRVLAMRTRDVSHRLHIKSMPQFFFARFGSKKMKIFAAVIIFVFLTPYSASVYNGLTSVCHVVLGVDEGLCRIIIAAVSAFLLILGGYIATLKADFVQGIIMFFGVIMLIVCVVCSDKVKGFAGISELWEEMKNVPDMRPLGGQNLVKLISTVILTSFGTWGLPQMIHKYYSIRDEKEVKRGMVISTVFAVIVAGGGYFIGSLSHLFFGSLGDLATGGTTDYLVPYMLLDSNLPVVLLGIILVLLVSASVSTLSSITLTACTTLTMDLIREKLKKDISDKKCAVLIRILCLVFVALSYVIAITKTPLFDMMSYSWGIISGSFLAPYLISLYWKKLSRAGAWAGMLGGFFVAFVPAAMKIAAMITGDNSPAIFTFLASKGAEFAVIAMLVSILLCVVFSLLRPAEDEKQKECAERFYTGRV